VSIGCGGSSSSNAIDAPIANDAAMQDARQVDAATATVCDPLARFGVPVIVAGLATMTIAEADPYLTSDELALYFSGGNVASGQAFFPSQLWAAHRRAVTDRFDEPNLLPVVNKTFDRNPTVGADGLQLWFASIRGGVSTLHLYSATRATTSDDFSTPMLDPNVNTTDPAAQDYTPFLTADGQQLWFTSTRPASPPDQTHLPHIWHVTREGRSFTTPRLEVAFAPTDQFHYSNPVLSADRLTIYVARTDVESVQSIWRSHRATVFDPFPAPNPVDELNRAFSSTTPGWLSADNCRFYYTIATSFDGEGGNIDMATRQP
jgi:hypothetical protein